MPFRQKIVVFQATKINLSSSLILFEAIQPQTAKLDSIFCVLHCITALERVMTTVAQFVWNILNQKMFSHQSERNSNHSRVLFVFESTTSWQGDHEMIMRLLTFYGYCLKYRLICANQRLSRNGLWPMLSSEPEYDSDLDISLHLILNFFSRRRAINS